MRHFIIVISLMWASFTFAAQVKDGGTGVTIAEGTLTQVSKLPAAEGNPYPDCYYTATIEIISILSGKSIPKQVILVLPGFFDRQYAPEARFKTGDKVRARLVPFASMSDKVRQTQQADEIEDVDLQTYFPQKISLVNSFDKPKTPTLFTNKPLNKKESISLQPIDPKASAARQETMRQDLAKINNLLAEHGGDWDKWFESQNNFRAQYKKQFDAKEQRWVGDSFFSAGQIEYGKGYSPEFVKSVIAFKNYLAARNVDLILVRVPQKGEIVEDLFTPIPADAVTNPYLLRLYKELLEADVEIITDIIPRARVARLKYPLMYWYQAFNEAHPAEGIARTVAEALAERLNRYEKIRVTPKNKFILREVSMELDQGNWLWSIEKQSPLWPKGNFNYNPKEYIRLSGVMNSDGSVLKRNIGSDSMVLMVGSSFTVFPSTNLGANIPSYLAFYSGINPEVFSRAGGDAAMPRMIAREADVILKNRIVCLFPMVPNFYKPLDLPPIIDTAKTTKVLLFSYTGDVLQKQIQFSATTPTQYYNFPKDGGIRIQSPTKQSKVSADFRLTLPIYISKFSHFIIELETEKGEGAVTTVTYNLQPDIVHKSFYLPNNNDFFVFKTSTDYVADININDVRFGFPTVITCIKIYGVAQ